MADLLLYWQEHPPTHITVAAIARGLGGGGSSGRSTHRPDPAAGGSGGAGSMEQLATMLGPPAEKFRPPCRMLTSAANDPAQPASQTPAQHHG